MSDNEKQLKIVVYYNIFVVLGKRKGKSRIDRDVNPINTTHLSGPVLDMAYQLLLVVASEGGGEGGGEGGPALARSGEGGEGGDAVACGGPNNMHIKKYF